MSELVSGVRKLASDIFGVVTSFERMKGLWRHPLYSNAIYIMSARAADAVVGLVFWILAARFYLREDVGQASALLSATTLLSMLSNLGFGYGLIRFIGTSKNPVGLINSAFTVVAMVSAAAAMLFVIGPGRWSPAVVSLRDNPAYVAVFVLIVPVAAASGLTDNAFVAQRAGRFVLARNLVFNTLRLVLPLALAAYLQSFGLFVSWGAAVFISVLFGIFLFLPRAHSGYRFSLGFDHRAVGGMLRFSFANYASELFWNAPILILQSIIVANRLGSEANAYFAIAWVIASTLSALPIAVAMSLFAEGSHNERSLGQSIRQSLKMTFVMLTPAAVLVALLAGRLLALFGSEYSENATTVLRLFAVSSFPVAVNYLYFGAKRVQRRMRVVVVLIATAGAATLALSYFLLPRMGISGAGVAWLVSQTCITVWIAGVWARARWQTHRCIEEL